jgi:hypothetical protein
VSSPVYGFSIAPAYAFVIQHAGDPASSSQIGIVISSDPSLCSHLSAGELAHAFFLELLVGADNSQAAIAAQTYAYTAGQNKALDGEYLYYDGQCTLSDGGLKAGNVTLTGVGTTYAGTFDVTFDTGDHATGSFQAPICSFTGTFLCSGADPNAPPGQ